MVWLLRRTLLAVLGSLALAAAPACAAEVRLALVIGNDGYKQAPLATPANDAGLLAETLRAAGFDVTGARDLDQDALRRSIRDFLDKVADAGPDAAAFVYLAGYGLQYEGENYFVPVDARIGRDGEVPIQAVRVGDLLRPLAGLPAKVKIVAIDGARPTPFAKAGPPLAGGLALVEPEPGMLVAFNTAPGTIAPVEPGPYGAYGKALAEMIREGGLMLPDLFERVRLRVSEATKGAAVPWHAARIETRFVFLERAPDAPAPPAVESTAALGAKRIREIPADEAYAVALARDTVPAYEEFLAGHPGAPSAERVRAMLAARREALTWRRTVSVNTPDAYWSYLRRYPRGPHIGDAHRRLSRLAAQLEPPPGFSVIAYDVPPPPPAERVLVERPALLFEEVVYVPPPPPPAYILPPPEPAWVVLGPPPPPPAPFFLPTPVGVPVPVYVRPPVYVAAPPPPPVQQVTIINQTVNAAAPSAAPARFVPLPASVVPLAATRLPPSAAVPAPASAALPKGPAPLGKPLPVPPAQGSTAGLPGAGLKPGLAPTAAVPAPVVKVGRPGALGGGAGGGATPLTAVPRVPAAAGPGGKVGTPALGGPTAVPSPRPKANAALRANPRPTPGLQGRASPASAKVRQDLAGRPAFAVPPPPRPGKAGPAARGFPGGPPSGVGFRGPSSGAGLRGPRPGPAFGGPPGGAFRGPPPGVGPRAQGAGPGLRAGPGPRPTGGQPQPKGKPGCAPGLPCR